MPSRPPVEELMARRSATRQDPAVDCHLHSTASDGAWAPEEVVAQAHRRGLKIIALTDHDRVSGVPAALEAGVRWGLTVIPAVELDTFEPETGLSAEILGYDLDAAPSGVERMAALCQGIARQRMVRLKRLLERVRTACRAGELEALSQPPPGLRWNQNPHLPLTLEALLTVKLGRPVTPDEVPGLAAQTTLMMPDFCRFLLRGGFISPPSASVAQVKAAFFSPGQPLHVDSRRLTPREAIGAIHACGGRAVLAHPGLVRGLEKPWLSSPAGGETIPMAEWITHLRHLGLDGLELYFYRPHTTPGQGWEGANRHVAALAHRLNLFVTFGSDCHGPGHPESEPLLGQFGGSRRQSP